MDNLGCYSVQGGRKEGWNSSFHWLFYHVYFPLKVCWLLHWSAVALEGPGGLREPLESPLGP